MSQNLLHSFPSQEKDEPVFVFARPYWFAFLPTIFIFLVIFAFSVVAQLYISGLPLGLSAYTANLIILGFGIFQLVVLIVFLVAVLDYYFDILIVTDRRLVEIDQEQLFYRKISELNLLDIEDTSFTRGGIFQTLLDYGSILVQTAGEKENFNINNLRHPSQIATIISDLSDQAKAGKPDNTRFPETEVIGVIEGELITDPDKLVIRGAMLPEDARRTLRNTP